MLFSQENPNPTLGTQCLHSIRIDSMGKGPTTLLFLSALFIEFHFIGIEKSQFHLFPLQPSSGCWISLSLTNIGIIIDSQSVHIAVTSSKQVRCIAISRKRIMIKL